MQTKLLADSVKFILETYIPNKRGVEREGEMTLTYARHKFSTLCILTHVIFTALPLPGGYFAKEDTGGQGTDN